MTIKDFQETYQLSDGTLDGKIRAVAFITGKSIEEVEAMPIDKFKELGKGLEPIKVSEDQGYKPVIRLGGLKLHAVATIKELTAGEFLDLTHFTKTQDSIIDNLHKILAIFYKPRKRWFRKVTIDRSEVSERIRTEMDVRDAYGYAVFFLKSWNLFTRNIEGSLVKELRKKLVNLDRMKKTSRTT